MSPRNGTGNVKREMRNMAWRMWNEEWKRWNGEWFYSVMRATVSTKPRFLTLFWFSGNSSVRRAVTLGMVNREREKEKEEWQLGTRSREWGMGSREG